MTPPQNKDRDLITIVGGRPLHRAVDVSQLPTGIEQALTLASLDWTFREHFVLEPVAAAQTKGISLQPAEEVLLRQTPAETLRSLSQHIVLPRAMSRRQFVKPVAASIVALLTGSAFLLCSGCTGADSWNPSDAGEAGANQLWMQIAGHPCYVYLCPASLKNPSSAVPVLVALHDQGETCLSNALRWRASAETYSFNLLSVNWTEEASTQSALAKLVADLKPIVEEFSESHAVTVGARYLCARGASTPLVWKAGFEQNPGTWQAATLLGGLPEGDWLADPSSAGNNILSNPPALFYVQGTEDTALPAAKAVVAQVQAKGGTAHLEQVTGSTSNAVLDFSLLWNWMRSPA